MGKRVKNAPKAAPPKPAIDGSSSRHDGKVKGTPESQNGTSTQQPGTARKVSDGSKTGDNGAVRTSAPTESRADDTKLVIPKYTLREVTTDGRKATLMEVTPEGGPNMLPIVDILEDDIEEASTHGNPSPTTLTSTPQSSIARTSLPDPSFFPNHSFPSASTPSRPIRTPADFSEDERRMFAMLDSLALEEASEDEGDRGEDSASSGRMDEQSNHSGGPNEQSVGRGDVQGTAQATFSVPFVTVGIPENSEGADKDGKDVISANQSGLRDLQGPSDDGAHSDSSEELEQPGLPHAQNTAGSASKKRKRRKKRKGKQSTNVVAASAPTEPHNDDVAPSSKVEVVALPLRSPAELHANMLRVLESAKSIGIWMEVEREAGDYNLAPPDETLLDQPSDEKSDCTPSISNLNSTASATPDSSSNKHDTNGSPPSNTPLKSILKKTEASSNHSNGSDPVGNFSNLRGRGRGKLPIKIKSRHSPSFSHAKSGNKQNVSSSAGADQSDAKPGASESKRVHFSKPLELGPTGSEPPRMQALTKGEWRRREKERKRREALAAKTSSPIGYFEGRRSSWSEGETTDGSSGDEAIKRRVIMLPGPSGFDSTQSVAPEVTEVLTLGDTVNGHEDKDVEEIPDGHPVLAAEASAPPVADGPLELASPAPPPARPIHDSVVEREWTPEQLNAIASEDVIDEFVDAREMAQEYARLERRIFPERFSHPNRVEHDEENEYCEDGTDDRPPGSPASGTSDGEYVDGVSAWREAQPFRRAWAGASEYDDTGNGQLDDFMAGDSDSEGEDPALEALLFGGHEEIDDEDGDDMEGDVQTPQVPREGSSINPFMYAPWYLTETRRGPTAQEAKKEREESQSVLRKVLGEPSVAPPDASEQNGTRNESEGRKKSKMRFLPTKRGVAKRTPPNSGADTVQSQEPEAEPYTSFPSSPSVSSPVPSSAIQKSSSFEIVPAPVIERTTTNGRSGDNRKSAPSGKAVETMASVDPSDQGQGPSVAEVESKDSSTKLTEQEPWKPPSSRLPVRKTSLFKQRRKDEHTNGFLSPLIDDDDTESVVIENLSPPRIAPRASVQSSPDTSNLRTSSPSDNDTLMPDLTSVKGKAPQTPFRSPGDIAVHMAHVAQSGEQNHDDDVPTDRIEEHFERGGTKPPVVVTVVDEVSSRDTPPRKKVSRFKQRRVESSAS
ncbi:hypothetical protein M427DRAFT_156583 [Gonapodya prolifera JEL478]|uniref:Uncharacterized protein n=1 Tax=Gonapodya prolifera (strain JEL478) TaxID=1344416 RepID=A0A139AAC7_GONPJ|nr:hypothetical protein M427DRAFT_156583 [Gonapodya prolifera JEL478]|eukprot:KXS13455.1 hypothetical protein M427DRAFT_156583 [Gonapodya prolifera JEL478]